MENLEINTFLYRSIKMREKKSDNVIKIDAAKFISTIDHSVKT